MKIDAKILTVGVSLGLLFFFILVPFVSLFFGSFGFGFLPGSFFLVGRSFTVEYYIESFNPRNLLYLFNSLFIAFSATAISTAIALTQAWILSRTDTPFKRFFDILFISPFFVSPLLYSISWICAASPGLGITNVIWQDILHLKGPIVDIYSIWGVCLVMGLHSSTITYVLASGSLKSMDSSLEETSFISGAGILQTAIRVTLPIAMPGILSGILLTFILNLGIFSVPATIGSPIKLYVIPTKVYRLLSDFPPKYTEAAALSMILVSISIAIHQLYREALRKSEKYAVISPRGFRPFVINLGRWRYLTFAICLLIVIITLAYPLSTLIIVSLVPFVSSVSEFQFSLNNYELAMSYPHFTESIYNSLLFAAISATLCVLISIVLSYVIVKTRARGRGVVEYLSMLPMGIPGTALALAFLIAWVNFPGVIYRSMWILVFAYFVENISYGVKSGTSGMIQISPDLEDSSKLCGASWLDTMRYIMVPLLKHGLLAAWVLIFIHAVRELSASIFLYSPGNVVMSTLLYDMLAVHGSLGRAAAFSVMQILILFGLLLILYAIGKIDVKKALA